MQNGTHGTAVRNGRYTVAEVAELLGITTRAVRKRIDAGRLQAARTPHGWAVQLDAEPAAELPAPVAELTAPAELEEPAAPTEPLAARAEPLAELAALREQVAWLQAEI